MSYADKIVKENKMIRRRKIGEKIENLKNRKSRQQEKIDLKKEVYMEDKKYDIETLGVVGKVIDTDDFWEKEDKEAIADSISKMLKYGMNKKDVIEIVKSIIGAVDSERLRR